MNEARPTTGGRTSRPPPWHGIDRDNSQRPGVPMATEARPAEGVHWQVPTPQPPHRTHFRRKGLEALTPVFGTAQPPRGVSGWLRGLAYRSPEHDGRHWAMLVLADRVDVLESRAGRLTARPLTLAGLQGVGKRVERNPAGALLLAAGAAGAGYAAGRVLRRTLVST